MQLVATERLRDNPSPLVVIMGDVAHAANALLVKDRVIGTPSAHDCDTRPEP